ncbi:MAG: serine hydrolase [Planctomycetota bacterium]|jgi:hypothetical protein
MKKELLNRRKFLGAAALGAGLGAGTSLPATRGGCADIETQFVTARAQIEQSEDGVVFHRTERDQTLMEGFPPPEDQRVTIDDYTDSVEKTRWAFQNTQVVFKTVEVERGNGPVDVLMRKMVDPKELDKVIISWGKNPEEAERLTVADWLRRTHTDALLVLHKGQIVAEQYFGTMLPSTRHLVWSWGKSLLATVFAKYVHAGELDDQAVVERYIPELSRTALKGATLRQLLDQQTGLAFREFLPPKVDPATLDQFTFGTTAFRRAEHEYAQYERTAGVLPKLPGEPADFGLYDFLLTQTNQARPHGEALWYAEPNVLLFNSFSNGRRGAPL